MIKYFKSPDSALEKPIAWLKGAAVFFIVTALLVVINTLQVSSLIILPFSPKLFRYLNSQFHRYWWYVLLFIMYKIYKMRIVITGDDLPLRENIVLMANHQQMADIPVLGPLAFRQKSLGSIKWFAKDVIKYVPGPGWGMHFIGCVFLKRDWAKDKDSIEKTFAGIRRHRTPTWMIMFVEGTRITEAKLATSQEYARRKNLPIPSHTMIPRTKGFAATIEGLGDFLDAVYDVTIGYPGGIPSLTQLFQGYVKEVHVHVRRIPLRDVPRDYDGISRFVKETFQLKDNLMRDFMVEKKFPGSESRALPRNKT